ncbi:type II toxin-antitoxin system RelB/DinJ family antitoxin [Lentilactobacillus otakiensis]|uniref:type II toxin-antitoxin system RelB/DinJ family antitoxin n=1 Tax=Lentilactobacillus otakiensis TaxID=481720 RepID=UPI003D1810BF
MARIEARIDSEIKDKARIELANHGLTISDFIRMTLTTIANEGLPKYYSLPNKELLDSLQEVVDDISGKKQLPEAHSSVELEHMLNENDDETENNSPNDKNN